MAIELPLLMDEATCVAEDTTIGTFPEVLREHQAMVFSIAYHGLRNRALAEEVAQEVFFRLSSHLGSLASREHLVRWLRQVTSRLCIDELRRSKPGPSLEEVAEPAHCPEPGDPLLSEHLRRLVAALPHRARMAVVLRFQEDLEPAEIAEVLKESVHTVKSRLQRALATLRGQFQRLEGSRP